MEWKTKEVLEYLETFGVGHYQNISPLFDKFFPVADKFDGNKTRHQARFAQDFFIGLLTSKFIKGRDSEIRGLAGGNETNGFLWFDKLILEASIDTNGIELLKSYRNEKAAAEINQSIIDTNKNVRLTNKVIWLSVFATIVSAVITYFSYDISKITNSREQRKDTLVNTLAEKQLLLIQKERVLFLQQKTIDSLRNILNDKTNKLTTINDK